MLKTHLTLITWIEGDHKKGKDNSAKIFWFDSLTL